uniref:Transmembrane protein n=1 Tax=Medicago truncatula TaxID=3880 RepID=I3T4K5_MEDTR|nr:unknown [Medicago truncatula]
MVTLLSSLLCFLQLLLNLTLHSLPGSVKELLNPIVLPPPRFSKCFFPIKFFHKTTSPQPILRFILVVGSASTHKHGPVCESIIDEPITDIAPTIFLSQIQSISNNNNNNKKQLLKTYTNVKVVLKRERSLINRYTTIQNMHLSRYLIKGMQKSWNLYCYGQRRMKSLFEG